MAVGTRWEETVRWPGQTRPSNDELVLALVHQGALLDPGHHVAQLGANLLDRVLGKLGARGLERSLIDFVLQHPVSGKAAGLNIAEHALHFGLDLGRNHARTGNVFTVLRGVRHRIVNVGNAALIDEVDDQLHLAHALGVRHRRRITRLYESLVTGLHQLDEPTTQHRLFAEQIGLAFFLEGRFDNSCAAAADRRGIGKAKVVRITRSVLMDRNQARHARTTLIFRAHRVARPLGRYHQHVEIGARFDQIEMHVKAVREHQRRTVFHIFSKVIAINVALQLVGRQHHHHVRPFCRLGNLHDLEFFGFGFLHAGRALTQRHCNFFYAAITQIERVRVALASIADDGDLLAFDQVQVGVAIVVDTHGTWSSWSSFGYRLEFRRLPVAVLLGRSGSPGKPLRSFPLLLVPLPLDLHPAGVDQRKTGKQTSVFDHLRQIGPLLEAIRPCTGEADADAARIIHRVGLYEYAEKDQWDRQHSQAHRLHPLGTTHDGGNAGARDFNEAERQHQADELLDLFARAGDFENKALRRRVDHASAEGIRKPQGLDAVLALALDLDHCELAFDRIADRRHVDP